MTMKLRNRLIALVCLIIFISLGALIFFSTTSRKPFSVILFVADNITPSSLTAARLYSGGGDARLQLEGFPNSALCRNAATDFSVPDTASASTQIAAGKRVNRGSLCIEESGARLTSLLEQAAASGRSTGLVTSGTITGATAAAFYAKSLDSENKADIALQFTSHTPFDFVVGGGSKDFATQGKQEATSSKGATTPSKSVREETTLLHSLAELESQPFWKKAPQFGLLSSGPLYEAWSQDSSAPLLADLVRVAIKTLQTNRHGYLLVVDDPSIAAAAAANDGEAMLGRMLGFDQAIATARHYAGENALIVVCGRQNVGGFQLNGHPFLHDKGVAILAVNNQGYPSLSWSTGPGFSSESGETIRSSKKAVGNSNNPSVGILSQPSAYPLPRAADNAGDVISLGTGQGSEKIHGFMDLTDLHRIIKESL